MQIQTLKGPLGRHGDKWLFAFVAVVGIAVVALTDNLQLPKYFAVSICVVLMLMYAAATSLLPALRLRPDQAADNSYYLGLLFTLASLGMALIRFSTEGGADSILRNFGIAIGTTIVGLALRVFLSQFREDPDDLEYEARAALAESVRSLRGELDRSIVEMQTFAIGAKQVLHEMSEAAGKSTFDALNATVGRFEESAEEMGKRFSQAASALEQRTGAFDTSLQKMVTVVEALTDRIGSVRADPQLIEAGVRPAFDALQSHVAQFAETFEGEQRRLTKSLGALGKLADAVAALDESANGIAQSSQRLEQAAAAIDGGAQSFTRLDEASRSAADAALTYSQSVGEIAQQQARQGKEVTDALEKATQALADRTTSSLGEVDASIRQIAANLNSLNTEFSGSSEAVQRVRRELAEVAGWIITRLDAK